MIGQSVGSDASPLSCAFIERPSPLRKPSCKVRLFAPNRSRKYCQKVTVTTLSQTVSHPDFQLLLQTTHVRSHSRKWVHTRLSEKDCTQRLTRRNTDLPSPGHSTVLSCQRNPFYSTVLLYTYISRFSVNPQHQQKRKIRQSCRRNAVPNRFSSRFSTSRTNGPRSLSLLKSGKHSAFGERSHTAAHTPKEGGVSDGAAITTLDTYCTFTNIPGPGIRTAYFAAFGSWPGVRSRRTQRAFGTAMRLCASLFRGAAAPLGRVIFSLLPKLRLVHPALSAFRMCETRGGITTLSALYVLLKRRTPACQSG